MNELVAGLKAKAWFENGLVMYALFGGGFGLIFGAVLSLAKPEHVVPKALFNLGLALVYWSATFAARKHLGQPLFSVYDSMAVVLTGLVLASFTAGVLCLYVPFWTLLGLGGVLLAASVVLYHVYVTEPEAE